ALQVHGVRSGGDNVPTRAPGEGNAGDVLKDPPQPGEVAVDRTARTFNTALTPDPVDQPVGGDDVVGVQEQAEQAARSPAVPQRQGLAADMRLDAAEQTELHSPAPAVPLG